MKSIYLFSSQQSPQAITITEDIQATTNSIKKLFNSDEIVVMINNNPIPLSKLYENVKEGGTYEVKNIESNNVDISRTSAIFTISEMDEKHARQIIALEEKFRRENEEKEEKFRRENKEYVIQIIALEEKIPKGKCRKRRKIQKRK